MKTSEEYLKGWADARLEYQNTGGVQPHPPGYYDKDPEVGGSIEVEASEGVAHRAPPKPKPRGK